jgi:hypothetical protein
MENVDKGLAVTKWVLIVWLKIPQMPKNLSAQLVSASPKVLDFNEKRLNWASVVRGINDKLTLTLIPKQVCANLFAFQPFCKVIYPKYSIQD